MKTREEWREWALSLKPGDKVINERYSRCFEIETVEKVTPSGMVKTNKGMYYQSQWSNVYEGRGSTRGYIISATPELIQEAERQAAENEKAKARANTIRAAREACRYLRYDLIEMPYEMAVELLELVKKYEQKSEA